MAVVMKRTTFMETNVCPCDKMFNQIRTNSVPVGIFDCKTWAEAWIDKQHKEKHVSFSVVGVEFAPEIEG